LTRKSEKRKNKFLQASSWGKAEMGASSVIAALISSAPQVIRMLLGLSRIYLTLGWRVRKTRRAFERELISQGMSKHDAERLSICYKELKNSMLTAVRGGLGLRFEQNHD
jgi:hypothetical protein